MNHILRLLPETFKGSWCIAGGWAACPALAQDIDVWVYGRNDLSEARHTILEHMRLQLEAVKQHYNRPFSYESEVETEQRQANDRYFNIHINISKVAVVYARGSERGVKPIHLMVTDAPGPGETISAFDISTHAVAIDCTGRVFQHPEFTAPHVAPALLEGNCNAKSEPRYKKICNRFGHPHVITDFTVDEPRTSPVEQLTDDDIPF